MARVEAEAVRGEEGPPEIRLRIEGGEPAADGAGTAERPLTLNLSVEEAVAARNALNRALNDLGLPDQE